MELYNGIIRNTLKLFDPYTPKKLGVTGEVNWKMRSKNELILSSDAAFELGNNRLPSVSFSCVTTTKGIINEDEILLYGKELYEIDKDVPFGRITLLDINDLGDDDEAYKSIRNLEYIKFDVIPEGYMMRASSFDKREQVRVSKDAVKNKLSFETIGNAYINKLKEDKLVNHVKLIFISEDMPIFKKLTANANKTDKITFTLNHVLGDVNMDCATCDLREICDEVDGMRETHLRKMKKLKK